MALGFTSESDNNDPQDATTAESVTENDFGPMAHEDQAVTSALESRMNLFVQFSGANFVESSSPFKAGGETVEEVSYDTIRCRRENLMILLKRSTVEDYPNQMEANGVEEAGGRPITTNTPSTDMDTIDPRHECELIDQLFEQEMESSLIKDSISSLDENSDIDADDITRAVKWFLERHSAVFQSSNHLKEIARALKLEEMSEQQLQSTPRKMWTESSLFKFEIDRPSLDSGISDSSTLFSTQMSCDSEGPFSRQNSEAASTSRPRTMTQTSLLSQQLSMTQSSVDEGNFSDYSPSPARRQSSVNKATQSTVTTQGEGATAAEGKCKKCRGASTDTFFLPCGHRVMCNRCVASVRKCPLQVCGRYIATAVQFFRQKYSS